MKLRFIAGNHSIQLQQIVLLLLAECLNETNKRGEVLPYLDQVRKRAGLNAKLTQNPGYE